MELPDSNLTLERNNSIYRYNNLTATYNESKPYWWNLLYQILKNSSTVILATIMISMGCGVSLRQILQNMKAPIPMVSNSALWQRLITFISVWKSKSDLEHFSVCGKASPKLSRFKFDPYSVSV